MKNKSLITGIILLALTLLLAIGSVTFISACGPTEDGSWMTCHWAGRAVTGIAAVLVVISAAHLLVKDAKIQLGLSIAILPAAILTAFVPGSLIKICGMASMHCNTHIKPGALVLGVLIAVAALADILINWKAQKD